MVSDFRTAKVVSPADIVALAAKATASPRRRSHRNLHAAPGEPVQRLLMAAEPDTYVQPHRHPDKPWEMIVLLSGALDVLLFSEDGQLEQRVALRPDGERLIEYPGGVYHAAVVLEPATAVLEIKQGPYDPATAKELPAWAPAENTDDGAPFRDFMRVMKVGARAG
ncbi:MAG: WbuC family cupin fold metalloprotein [Rhodospirillales bacterium]